MLRTSRKILSFVTLIFKSIIYGPVLSLDTPIRSMRPSFHLRITRFPSLRTILTTFLDLPGTLGFCSIIAELCNPVVIVRI